MIVELDGLDDVVKLPYGQITNRLSKILVWDVFFETVLFISFDFGFQHLRTLFEFFKQVRITLVFLQLLSLQLDSHFIRLNTL